MTDEWSSAPLEGIVFDEVPVTMDTQVRDLWVSGLLSGAYEQGYTRLRSQDDQFTALGVLCDIAVRLGICTWDCVDGEYFIAPMQPPATGAYLPLVVRDWAKIRGAHPSQDVPLVVDGVKHPIWRMTDIFKVPFPQVAALIKQQY